MGRSIQRVYVERAVADHPRTLAVLARFPRATRIPCERYGEVFNRRAQSFRLQKRRPALVLAEKFDRFVLPAPPGYGIGGRRNFYFSHSLNCLYDCRYCFLQGMFRSAHHVLFVNYESFQQAIDDTLAEMARPGETGGEPFFFSGYDGDSLALEPVTGFAAEFLPFFAARPGAWLELRTKSTRIEALLERDAIANCVVAFSFTPAEVHAALEVGVPSIERRLAAMAKLQERGWPLGLRFDPLMYSEDFETRYRRLFEQVFRRLDPRAIHSVSLGGFRLPRTFYERLYRLYPEDRLFAGPLDERDGMVAFPRRVERRMLDFCAEQLLRHLPPERLFRCDPKTAATGGEAISPPGSARPAPSLAHAPLRAGHLSTAKGRGGGDQVSPGPAASAAP